MGGGGGGVAIVSDDKHRPPRAHPAIQESALIKQQRVKLIWLFRKCTSLFRPFERVTLKKHLIDAS